MYSSAIRRFKTTVVPCFNTRAPGATHGGIVCCLQGHLIAGALGLFFSLLLVILAYLCLFQRFVCDPFFSVALCCMYICTVCLCRACVFGMLSGGFAVFRALHAVVRSGPCECKHFSV